MNTKYNMPAGGRSTLWTLALALVFIFGTAMESQAKRASVGKRIAQYELSSALNDASADYWLEIAKAENLPTKEERADAAMDARKELRSNFADVKDQYHARLDVADMLGGGRYNPEIEPADFLTPSETTNSPNPFFPLIPGSTHVYQSVTSEGMETVTVYVTHDTREILDVTCIVVHDFATLNGELIEDTLDWYAQDQDGNVWYFGEQSLSYENGKVASIDGSWEAGEDGALPGIIMKAGPTLGDVYRQEYAIGEAEDVAEVQSVNASETVPFGGTYNNCVQTEDFTAMEPDNVEHKFFAPGVGEILSVDLETGAREELIDVVTE